ncbi:hypothetical protein MMA231_01942 [Asticcacaulis sp. MM231]|uniref:M56 family metallopeptidase n=1 Tax=Asticcacaulis sp. MM231 TaxID=3157666 RepID=UPI0032D59794
MSPHMEALGYTLVHFCWQAALIAALYKLADLCLPRLRAQGRYMLSLTALLAMFAAAVITFIYEDLRITQAAAVDFTGVVIPALGAQITQELKLSALLPWLDAFWLIGVATLSFRMLSGLWYIHSLKKHAQPVPAQIAHRFALALRRFGLTNKVHIRLHPAINGPFVVGALRSVVYLPLSAVTALTPEQLDTVLSHELEHIRRADYVWNLIQSAVEILFFYHPAVWWIGAKLREQRELCCDDAAIRSCDDPITYATALLSLEEQRRCVPVMAPNLTMALNGHGKNDLLARISRILGESAEPRLKARPVAFVLLPLMLLTLTAFAAAPVRDAAVKICPQAATDAFAHLEDVVTGARDLKVQSEDAQVAKNDLEVADYEHEAPEYAAMEADDIDPDAIAAQARADALAARAEIARAKLTDINPEQIAAEARASALQAKAEMERNGIKDRIDVEAIVAQARADAEAAKANVAQLAIADIDPDRIAAEARAGAMQARAEQQAAFKAQREFSKIKAPKASKAPKAPKAPKVPKAPVAPAEPADMYPDEVPAPLAAPEAPEAPALPAAWSLAPPAAPAAPKAWREVRLITKPVNMVVVTPPRPVAEAAPVVRLDRLPAAVAKAIPAPNPTTDIVINLHSTPKASVQLAVK